jgi:hypothetical protein
MHVSFQADGDFGVPPDRDMGVHVHGWMIAINPEAEGSYISLESIGTGALYRLSRERLAIRRTEVAGGNVMADEDGRVARWWLTEDLGEGPFQAVLVDTHARKMVAYIDVDERGRLCYVDDDAEYAIETLFGDYPCEGDLFGYDFGNVGAGHGYPTERDFAAIARAVLTTIEAVE